MIFYSIERDGKSAAHAVTLPNGKCVVSWPTSTIVYDSEQNARAVHIDHMGGRGEPTHFNVELMSKATDRGWQECYQDRCEGVPLRLRTTDGVDVPDYIPEEERFAFALGYAACAMTLYGTDWLSTEFEWKPVLEIVEEPDHA